MKRIALLFIIALFAGCSSKDEPKNTGTENPGPGQAANDCKDYLQLNVEKCTEELRKAKSEFDSTLVYEYCDCVYREIVNNFTCEQIKALKKLSEDDQKKTYQPFKDKCYELYLKKDIGRIREQSKKDKDLR